MREIKFKLYHKVDKRFLDKDELHSFNISPVDGHVLFLDGHDCSDIIIPLQYTGLKDKNGTEIYEGDLIIDHDLDGTKVREVKIGSYYNDADMLQHYGVYNQIDGKDMCYMGI